jgi:hypothetical protein
MSKYMECFGLGHHSGARAVFFFDVKGPMGCGESTHPELHPPSAACVSLLLSVGERHVRSYLLRKFRVKGGT